MADTNHALPPNGTRARTSKLAVWSMVAGIASMFCSFLTGIPAVIMGMISLNRIGKSNHGLTGSGFAIAGIITGVVCGVIGTAALAGLAAPMVIQQRHKAEAVVMTSKMRNFLQQVAEHEKEHGALPDKYAASVLLSGIPLSAAFKGDWLYFPDASLSAPADILLISPDWMGRFVLRSNGIVNSVRSESEIGTIIESSGRTPVAIPAFHR
jgi:hypothetical protein